MAVFIILKLNFLENVTITKAWFKQIALNGKITVKGLY